MRKLVKITAIAGIVCCLVGVGVITAGAMMGGDEQVKQWFNNSVEGNFSVSGAHHQESNYRRQEGTSTSTVLPTGSSTNVYQGIRKIEIDAALGFVEIHTEDRSDSTDTSIRVEAHCDESHGTNPYAIVQEREELKIENRNMAHKSGGTHHDDCNLNIYVPKNYTFDSLEVEMATGQFKTSHIAARELDLVLASGDMNLGNIQADQVDIECMAGNIELELSGRKADYNYDIECAAGKVILGGAKADTFSSVHREEKIQNGARKSVDVECAAGNVTIEYTEE